LKLSSLWDANDFWNGALLASIFYIVYSTIFNARPDYDLAVKYPGNPPYGVLWYILNPFYATQQLYAYWLLFVFAVMLVVYWKLIKMKWLDARIVKLWVFSIAVLYALHGYQDVTIVAFAPLATITPILTAILVLQKIPFPGTDQWNCAFNGNGTTETLLTNPCISNSLKLAWWTHVYFFTYLVLLLWAVLPIVIWLKTRRKYKVC